MSSTELLAALARAIADGGVQVVDLTQPLGPSTPVIQLPPSVRAVAPVLARGRSRTTTSAARPGTGTTSAAASTRATHFDAPVHWITGRERGEAHTDTIPPQKLIAPACVIDCSAEAAADEDFLLEPAHVEAWEARHGRIPAGSWVLMRTDWWRRGDPAAFLNAREDGPHVPGPSVATMRLLVEGRDVRGWGVETVGTDAGQAHGFEPPFPAHNLLHGAGKIRARRRSAISSGCRRRVPC